MEPELGLGIITEVEFRMVKIHFPASECFRMYAKSSAPIKRVAFNIGDSITSHDGSSFTITDISENAGLLVYFGEGIKLPENELSDALSFTSPKERLFSGLLDTNKAFHLRYRAHLHTSEHAKSSARGFIGGRIDLIPHQLFVANEIASRQIPRVLLSDEVGLGKTIEACLIVHRLLLSGRASRVLIMVPESLVHQWFVELYRRFNLLFRIFDNDYCRSLTENNRDLNVFLDEELALVSIDFLANSPKWAKQAVIAGWDMLVVDEAHHLLEETPEYNFVENLSAQTNGLLLLTATPEQLGHKSHFARLHLLDSARFYDFDKFEQEEKQYFNVAKIANKILTKSDLTNAETAQLSKMLPGVEKLLQNEQSDKIINDLLDRHGMGRVVFRNTRAAMPNFPKRQAFLFPLNGDEGIREKVNKETSPSTPDDLTKSNFKNDPRIHWLVDFLRKHRKKKTLLICKTLDKVFAIEKAIQDQVLIKVALFHEDLTLLQRDRNAAWFSEPDGAQLLICSEIGSEGRNFQFTNTLVLFDLPQDPELLEQRIGRLDRIGQKQTIKIYVPFVKKTAHEALALWYHNGLEAFEKNVPGVFQIFQKVQKDLISTLENPTGKYVEKLVTNTIKIRSDITKQMEEGRDRLLELHSFQPQAAQKIKDSIKTFDDSKLLDNFMLKVFDEFGIRYRDLPGRTYQLDFRAMVKSDFPLPPMHSDGMVVTFDRKTALSREEIAFLSWDHPMVIGAIDVMLGSESGNCASAKLESSESPEVMLEAIYILECVAPKNLNADRFLPPTPIRVLVNHAMEDCTDFYPPHNLAKQIRGSAESLLENPQIKEMIPDMIKETESLAAPNQQEFIYSALEKMDAEIGNEIHRLQELQKINPNIKNEEIENWQREEAALKQAISTSRLRLDALRLIYKGS